MNYKLIDALLMATVIPILVFIFYTLVVIIPVGVYTESECMKLGYSEYKVSFALDRFCVKSQTLPLQITKMTAIEELIEHAAGRKIKCATITRGDSTDNVDTFNLKVGGDTEAFMNSLNFDYNSSFRYEEIFGTVWWYDGSWSSRDECCGCMQWEHHYVPEIPDNLIQRTDSDLGDCK